MIRKRIGGFTVAEVIVALAVVAVVSMAALSIVLSSLSARTAAVRQTQAQNLAGNVLECFKAAGNQAEFQSAVAFSEGINLEGTAEENGWVSYRHTSDTGCTAVIRVRFAPDARSELRVEITDDQEHTLVGFSYEKGDSP